MIDINKKLQQFLSTNDENEILIIIDVKYLRKFTNEFVMQSKYINSFIG